ncbi:MAG: hypothetical protein Q8L45_05350 [Xanthomonadaceae bacterium]|nr:hypothetical protein [Xanthomonadaceae bacterium]MDP2186398.1 hypothetical protein [Xanthomonadales bacterium]MDZ4115264.1 hypothetical protein [Xanthomonadaceae bacterium]MDZ4378339.1 hypothetical protein [Xanthomonadaceae bacterium]
MSDNAATDVKEALALTDAMREAASRDDWAAVTALDAQRQALLEQACAQGAVDADGLTLLREHNDALIILVKARRDSLAGEWHDSKKNQRAMRDYQRIARDQGA